MSFDFLRPTTWLIEKVDSVISSNAEAFASSISNTITPLASICFGIYVLLMAVNYMRGAEQEPVISFGLKAVGFSLIIGLGLNASNYTSTILPIVKNIGPDIANAISDGRANSQVLDELLIHYLTIFENSYRKAKGVEETLLAIIKIILLSAGAIPFLVVTTVMIIIANTGSTIVAIVGPIFFAFLIFPATRQYFSAWLNTVFSYALIPIIISAISTIAIGISKEMMLTRDGLAETFSVVFYATAGNLVLLFMILQVSSLASSLSAGGINAAMPNLIRIPAKGKNSGKGESKKEASGESGNRKGSISNGKGSLRHTAHAVGRGIGNVVNAASVGYRAATRKLG